MNVTPARPCAAMLQHLTGPSRGSCSWLIAGTATAWLTPDNHLVLAADAGPQGATPAALFTCGPDGIRIEAGAGADLWVNRRPVHSVTLRHGDMIEFGETGPLSRVRIFDDIHLPPQTIGGIFGDEMSYLRASRRPLGRRVPRAMADTLRRLVRDTTLMFRAGVVVTLVLLAAAVGYQYWAAQRLRVELESGSIKVETLAAALAEARRDTIRAGDLKALSDELQARVAMNAERLETLEAHTGAGARIIAAAEPWVAFLQGSYGLRDRASGRMLHHVLAPGGLPLILPNGQPLLALDGDGPVAEVLFNGTGFLLGDPGVLITNRHVARPWEKNPGLRGNPDGLEPAMLRFIAYFPGRAEPVVLVEAAVDDDADLAVLLAPELTATGDGLTHGLTHGLTLAAKVPAPGDQVIVMGYPTGLMSLLARSGPDFVETLRETGETGFWEVARRLSAAGLMAPLSSGGIVGQVGLQSLVYDAETTEGGSGGPVLNLRGEVVAINTAIMPEFGGSNLGVPAGRIPALLARLAADR